MPGNASAALTLDRYAALFDDDLDVVAERLVAAARIRADFLRTICRLTARMSIR
jgi:hypothetical protein